MVINAFSLMAHYRGRQCLANSVRKVSDWGGRLERWGHSGGGESPGPMGSGVLPSVNGLQNEPRSPVSSNQIQRQMEMEWKMTIRVRAFILKQCCFNAHSWRWRFRKRSFRSHMYAVRWKKSEKSSQGKKIKNTSISKTLWFCVSRKLIKPFPF